MKSLYYFLIPFLIASFAFATDYDGIVTRYKSKLAIVESKSQKTLVFTFKNLEIQSQIKNLSPGDYISFEGVRSSTETSISITSLNYIGLKALIGNWSGNDNFCYEIINFNEMYVFKREKARCDFKLRTSLNSRYLTYTINPTVGAWLALISDDVNSYVAEVRFKSSVSASLSLYDSDSGDILKTIVLKK